MQSDTPPCSVRFNALGYFVCHNHQQQHQQGRHTFYNLFHMYINFTVETFRSALFDGLVNPVDIANKFADMFLQMLVQL